MFRCPIAPNLTGPCFHRAATIPNEVIFPDIADRLGAPLDGLSWQPLQRFFWNSRSPFSGLPRSSKNCVATR
jgi:hypothetical protein